LRVLVACEFSGIVRDAFAERGHDAWSCDLLPTEREGNHIQGDVLEVLDDGWDLMIAHPPCTYLTVTGNRWFKPEYKERFPTREQDRKDAIEFFMALANAPVPQICVENPVGIMNTQWRKPNQIIQPFQFGHKEAKKTCLWLKDLPTLEHTKIVEPEYVTFKSGKRMAKWYSDAFKLPKIEREKVRSKTFTGIAKAMAEQWG
jgi:site-specific DNA-cytosine methylase